MRDFNERFLKCFNKKFFLEFFKRFCLKNKDKRNFLKIILIYKKYRAGSFNENAWKGITKIIKHIKSYNYLPIIDFTFQEYLLKFYVLFILVVQMF